MLARGLIAGWLGIAVLLSAASTQAEHGSATSASLHGLHPARQRVSLGVGAAAYGVLNEITVGTHVLPWFAFPLGTRRSPAASSSCATGARSFGRIAGGAFVYLPDSALSSALRTPALRVLSSS